MPIIVEQADWANLAGFLSKLALHPGKLLQAFLLRASLGAATYHHGAWVKSAEGDGKLSRIQIQSGSRTFSVDCDYLAIAYGFVPNTELAQLLGCGMKNGLAAVDEYQRSTISGVLCAGELTGLGGVDRSLVEGEIAGCAAAGRDDLALKCFPMRERAHRFADGLNQAFALRKQLQLLPEERTIVCRCEDVPHGKLNGAESWRSAKLHFRCGMGPCQGRICGPAVEFLYGWNRQSVRPPIFPVRVTSLISESKYIIEEGINK